MLAPYTTKIQKYFKYKHLDEKKITDTELRSI